MSRPPVSDPRRTLTLRDVSEASGVSEMTVSRVLRNRGDVSETTREKVLLATRQLGYVPNRIAGALASQRVNLVGVIIPSMSNMVFPEVMTGISETLEDTGLQPVVGITNYSPDREEAVLYEMLSWRPSGLIIAGLEHGEASRTMMESAGIPIVEIMDVDGRPVDNAVGISHRRAGLQMAEAIVAAGYRRIGFLGTKMPQDHRARKRLEGFREGLAGAGLDLVDEEYYSGGSTLLKGREMTEVILSRTPDLDFLYCSNDMIGAGGLLWCLENGLDVPGRLGLAGFNGVDLLDGL
ncbi:MAG: LacI family DNA-binding transcriptional regulator, partial [Gemmobacter sp.]|nr:LacI family DNA-binding transcriptional regulator [Gemmobacter sp.]